VRDLHRIVGFSEAATKLSDGVVTIVNHRVGVLDPITVASTVRRCTQTEKVRLDVYGHVFLVLPVAVHSQLFFGEQGRDATEVGLMLFHIIQPCLLGLAAEFIQLRLIEIVDLGLVAFRERNEALRRFGGCPTRAVEQDAQGQDGTEKQ